MALKAALQVQTAIKNGKTVLKNAYHTQPFKIANITENKSNGVLKLMLMSSSPGILDEDEYHISINLEEGSSLQLQTQSYQRLFTMKKSASQRMEVRMAPGSSFLFIPLPVVPHKAADFSTLNTIYLQSGCVLCWGEVLTCGRKLNGEVFQYTRYHNITQVYVGSRLVCKENLLMQPATMALQAIGRMEGYTHQASIICLKETMIVKNVIAALTETLALQKDILFGISTAPVNGIVVRLLGNKAEQLYKCLVTIAEQVNVVNGEW